MDLELFKIVVNASLFALIWVVQLVVYPGFYHYNEAELKRWHSIYTRRISIIVLPLMLGQLLVYIYASISNPVFNSLSILILILINWLVTFLVAVPLHNAIDHAENSMDERRKLVKSNWIRTINWTVILALSLYYYGK